MICSNLVTYKQISKFDRVKELISSLFGSHPAGYASYGIPGVDDDILADIIGDQGIIRFIQKIQLFNIDKIILQSSKAETG